MFFLSYDLIVPGIFFEIYKSENLKKRIHQKLIRMS